MTAFGGSGGRSVVLVSAELSLEALADSDDAARRSRAAEVLDWARRSGFELVALPEPGYRRRPGADPAERRRLGRADRSRLVAELRRLRSRLDADGRVAALLITDEDVWGQAGRAWAQRLAEAAEQVGIALPRPVRLSLDGGLDETRLEQRVLAEAVDSSYSVGNRSVPARD